MTNALCLRRLLLKTAALFGAFFCVFVSSQPAHAELPFADRYRWSLVYPPSLFSPTVPTTSSFSPSQVLTAKHTSSPIIPKAPKQSNAIDTKNTSVCTNSQHCKMDEKSEELIKVLHQIFGIGSLVLLTATVVIGQINAIDFFEGRLSSQTMLWVHRGLAIATAVAYGGARVLAWILPREPGEASEGGGFDSAKAHNILSWLHGIGMIALIVGGVLNRVIVPSSTDAKIAMTVGHLAAGYFTWATLSAAAVVITFF
ncbi:MAG: hypothetical protein H6727_03520 [Myxococcales bacterium]|nr:hypothetical protein [Myxococcales bacterium]